jgi:hypothetical protein
MSSLVLPLSAAAVLGILPDTEMAALRALYSGTHGAGWKQADGWFGDGPPCSTWFGVVCDSAHNNIVELHFHWNHLSGTIPSEFYQLPMMTIVHLHDNRISGTLPPQLGKLSSLKGLNPHTNALSGSIPVTIGQLDMLSDEIVLSGNRFSGALPSELGQLSLLRSFTLSENLVSGTVC